MIEVKNPLLFTNFLWTLYAIFMRADIASIASIVGLPKLLARL